MTETGINYMVLEHEVESIMFFHIGNIELIMFAKE